MAEAKILKNILATNLLRGADFWQALKWIRLNRKDQKSGKIYDLTDQDVSALRIDMMEALHIILQVVFETLRSQRKYAEINAWNLMNRLLYVVNPKMALDRQVQLLRYNAERGDKKVRALLKIANTLSRSDAPVHPIEIGRDGYQECYEAAAIRLLRIAFKSAQDTELDISPSETQEQLVNARLMNNAEAARIFDQAEAETIVDYFLENREKIDLDKWYVYFPVALPFICAYWHSLKQAEVFALNLELDKIEDEIEEAAK